MNYTNNGYAAIQHDHSRGKYVVNGWNNCSLVLEWIGGLNDPLVYAEFENLQAVYGNNSETFPGLAHTISITASGSNESVLLLRYGHILEQVL